MATAEAPNCPPGMYSAGLSTGMASSSQSDKPVDRLQGRRRPFSSLVRKLATLKHHATNNFHHHDRKTVNDNLTVKKRRELGAKNNPCPQSASPLAPTQPNSQHTRELTCTTTPSPEINSITTYDAAPRARSGTLLSTHSAAPTSAAHTENPGIVSPDASLTKHGVELSGRASSAQTAGGNSTASSPRSSQESLTTTLTTMQSTAPSAALQVHGANAALPTQSSVQHPYTSSPQHMRAQALPLTQPHTYSAAIANNMLTDNASLLTLASSSKRRRRHSLDTNASVRALAPSSLFGNSRESLPLSVLSSNVETLTGVLPSPSPRPPIGHASAERASVYSSSGITPALHSEHNSYYAAKQIDGASVRSGLLGHGKPESTNGSITGMNSAPLTSHKEAPIPDRHTLDELNRLD